MICWLVYNVGFVLGKIKEERFAFDCFLTILCLAFFCFVIFAGACFLEYHITLLRVTEPPEDRMEQALFSPPLSKQRVEYALQHIKESCATTLVTFTMFLVFDFQLSALVKILIFFVLVGG